LPFFFLCPAHPRALHSFPTRRSSDLFSTALALANADESARAAGARRTRAAEYDALLDDVPGCTIPTPDRRGLAGYLRYPVLFETGEARDRLADAHRLDGVAASYPMPLPQL